MIWERIEVGLYAYIKGNDRVGYISYKGRRKGKHSWIACVFGGRTRYFTSLREAKAELINKLG